MGFFESAELWSTLLPGLVIATVVFRGAWSRKQTARPVDSAGRAVVQCAAMSAARLEVRLFDKVELPVVVTGVADGVQESQGHDVSFVRVSVRDAVV